jgi:hypothetical protein
MKTTLLLLSSVLSIVSTQFVRADTIQDVATGTYTIGVSTIRASAQVLGTNGGDGGPILTFITGALQSGTIGNGVFAAGGSFVLTDYQCAGCDRNPQIWFSGSFSGPTAITTNPQGIEILSGPIAGTLRTGIWITGNTTQNLMSGTISGSTYFEGKNLGLTAPEPSTLTFLFTGLLALAGPMRRKFLPKY